MTRVACIGEAMIELSLRDTTAQVGVAGDTLNTAIYLKRSAPALDVDYVTCLGDDPFSDRIGDFIASQDIGCSAVSRIAFQCVNDPPPYQPRAANARQFQPPVPTTGSDPGRDEPSGSNQSHASNSQRDDVHAQIRRARPVDPRGDDATADRAAR